MKRILLTFMMLVLLPMTLDAKRNGEGFFIGLGSGITYYDDGGLVSDLNGNGGNYDMNSVSGAYKLYLGYKFNHEATLEGSLTGYGVYDIKNSGSTTERLDPKSAAVCLNYGQDFWHNQIRPFVLAGVGLLWLDPQESTLYDNTLFFSLHYGLGLLYTPHSFDGWGLRAAYEADWSRFDAKSDLGVGGNYNTIIGTLYLGVEYKF
jgi:hypothetical protein